MKYFIKVAHFSLLTLFSFAVGDVHAVPLENGKNQVFILMKSVSAQVMLGED